MGASLLADTGMNIIGARMLTPEARKAALGERLELRTRRRVVLFRAFLEVELARTRTLAVLRRMNEPLMLTSPMKTSRIPTV